MEIAIVQVTALDATILTLGKFRWQFFPLPLSLSLSLFLFYFDPLKGGIDDR